MISTVTRIWEKTRMITPLQAGYNIRIDNTRVEIGEGSLLGEGQGWIKWIAWRF